MKTFIVKPYHLGSITVRAESVREAFAKLGLVNTEVETWRISRPPGKSAGPRTSCAAFNPTNPMPTQSQPTALPKHTPWICHRRPGQPESQTSVWACLPDGQTVLLFSSNNTDCVDAVTSHNSHPALVAENKRLRSLLAETEVLAVELMERADRIDEKLTGGNRDCELGQITRMRGQLSKNRAALAKEDV